MSLRILVSGIQSSGMAYTAPKTSWYQWVGALALGGWIAVFWIAVVAAFVWAGVGAVADLMGAGWSQQPDPAPPPAIVAPAHPPVPPAPDGSSPEYKAGFREGYLQGYEDAEDAMPPEDDYSSW